MLYIIIYVYFIYSHESFVIHRNSALIHIEKVENFYHIIPGDTKY